MLLLQQNHMKNAPIFNFETKDRFLKKFVQNVKHFEAKIENLCSFLNKSEYV